LSREGDWFVVPLRDGGFGVGLVARANKQGVVLGYFFGPRREQPPAPHELSGLAPSDAVLLVQFGDLHLRSGRWRVIGRAAAWSRADWANPVFGRFEVLTGRSIAVEYDDDDPNRVVRETDVERQDLSRYPNDGLHGASAVELQLTSLLDG
jgi:hypothetical protein